MNLIHTTTPAVGLKAIVIIVALSCVAVLVQRTRLGLTRTAVHKTIPENSAQIPAAAKRRLVDEYANLPLSFEANQGQTDPQVKFHSRGRGYSLFLTSNEVIPAAINPSLWCFPACQQARAWFVV